MRTILIGFMGTGKTSVGKLLSSKLNTKFIDMDNEIEKESKRLYLIYSRTVEKTILGS